MNLIILNPDKYLRGSKLNTFDIKKKKMSIFIY